uniref:2-amino-4-hydroxy-6-hydroxymethyldihydropteridine diphosphokinase n=1 Tax=Candidatus Actinomarina minuta TaxID=1389454 RepID=S5DM90_9ACTN|nr:7,8-dihydro-6-hydroxymethylpterin-pyrophosphokin ase [Candidatus Actinomarina minuta]
MNNLSSIYLSLGSNIGNRENNLKLALKELSEILRINKISSLYETEPLLYQKQDNFLNIVVEVSYFDEAESLLKNIKAIEKKMGREATLRFGPRIIDIDIIFFNGQEINDEILTIPHKEWKNRLFVIAPLYEVLDRKIEESKFNISNQKVIRIGSIKI